MSKPHSTAFEDLTRLERARETFVTVRRPVPWYLSMYNFKMHSGGGKAYELMEDNGLDDFLANVAFARNGVDGVMKWNRPAEHKQHIVRMLKPYFDTGANERIGFLTLNFLFYTTRKWRDLLAKPDPVAALIEDRAGLIEVRHILRQENLAIDFANMLGPEQTLVDVSRRVNSMNRNPYISNLDAETVAKIDFRDRFILSSFYS